MSSSVMTTYSTSTNASGPAAGPSSITSSHPPPVPLRSALRPKTSTSTITAQQEKSLAEEMLSANVPRQSYFEKYPIRAKKSKDRLEGEETSRTRAQMARERAKALKSGQTCSPYDSMGSESEPQGSRTTTAYAFPSLDDTTTTDDQDPGGASTSSDFTTPNPKTITRRRSRQFSATSASSKAPARAKVAVTTVPRVASPIFDSVVPPPSSSSRSRTPLSYASSYPHSPLSADSPFYRTSISSGQTQTTLADDDAAYNLALTTPKSSLYRADGVMVAAPSSNNGVETMDALVHQMNGGHPESDDRDHHRDLFSSFLLSGSGASAGHRSRDKYQKHGGGGRSSSGTWGPSSSSSRKGDAWKTRQHPLYHPPLPEPPKGVKLGTPEVSDRSTTESELEQQQNHRKKKPKSPPVTGVEGSGGSRPSSAHRSQSDGTIKSTTKSTRKQPSDLGGESYQQQSSRSHYRQKSAGSSRPGSRDVESNSARPSSGRSRIRDRDRGSRSKDYHHHRSASHRYGEEESSEANSPEVSQPPPPPVIVPSIDEIIQKNAPSLVTRITPLTQKRDYLSQSVPVSPADETPQIFPSIGETLQSNGLLSTGPPTRGKRSPRLPPSSFVGISSPQPDWPVEEEEVNARSSIDSVAAEVKDALDKAISAATAPARKTSVAKVRHSEDEPRVSMTSSLGRKNLQHAKSFGGESNGTGRNSVSRSSTKRNASIAASSEPPSRPFLVNHGSSWSNPAMSIAPSTPDTFVTFSASLNGSSTPGLDPMKHELAQYLRSPRLTRLLTLRRPPHAGLTVSLADVGSSTGHPVIVFLGLGCVRYLIALYDEMAEALNLRLVCVDRWGLGRTGEPKDASGRGLLEWASVIEEVADELGIDRFSVVAHSAGAPYALAGVCKFGSRRVVGNVHLLAPWVSMSVDGGYKWLKYVPNGLIKTAQAAEWKVQGWMLGKPPTITHSPVGFDATTGVSTHGPLPPSTPSPVESEVSELPSSIPSPVPTPAVAVEERSSLGTSEYDDLADFKGKYGSNSTLALPNGKQDAQGKGKKKQKPVKTILSLFNNGGGNGGASVNGEHSSSARSSRSNSITTLPTKTPKLKGLKSLSSLRTESTSGHMAPPQLDLPRRVSEPTTPSHLPDVAEVVSPTEEPLQMVSLPSHVGLGIGLDEDLMQWSSRLQMLEDMVIPPTQPPTASAPTPAPTVARTQSTNNLPRNSTTTRSSSETRRSVSLGSRNFAPSPLTIPPVPPLPAAVRETATSPIPSLRSGTPGPKKNGMSLANALLRASYAESLKGGTSDLLAILERDSKPWGFSYSDVKHRVKVWYGDKDDKIAIGSIHWMERVMKDCTINIVKGGTHNLMTNADVVVEVLESVAKDWETWNTRTMISPSSSVRISPFLPSASSGSMSSITRRRGRA